MNSSGTNPALVEAAFEAKQQHHELLVMELPLMPERSGPPSTTRPVAPMGDFIFRLLTFSEFDTFSKIAQLGDVSDIVVKAALVYPSEPWDKNLIQNVEPGFFEEAASIIVEASGFESKHGMFENLNTGRSLSNTIYGAAQMFICKAFSAISPRDIGMMTMPEMFRYLAMSEQMLAVEGRPTEFPIREFFKANKTRTERGYIPKDFSRLRVLTDDQAEAMKASGRMEAISNAIADRRALDQNPEAKAARSVEIRRRKMAEIAARREMDARAGAGMESDALAHEFGK